MNKKKPDFSSFFYLNPLPSWVYDLHTFQILDVNQAAIDHYGYSKGEFLGMTINDIRLKQEIHELDDLHWEVENREGNIYFGVFSHQKKNGDLIRMKINGHKQDYLAIESMMLVGQDVTEEEHQLKLHQTSEKRLKAASEIAKLGYWRLELDANTLSWTDEVYTIWGEDKNRFKVNFENFFQSIHPDDQEAFKKEQNAAFAGEKELNFIHRIILPDKSIKWVHELGRLVKDENGKKIAFEGTVQDISERKEGEQRLNRISEKLRESESRFRISQEMSPDGFTILHPLRNEEGEIVDFTWVFENQAIADINGTDPKEVIGKRLLELFPTHRDTALFDSYIHVANTGKTKILEEIYVGEIVLVPTWLRLVIVPMGDDIAILTQDITERKLAEEALRESEARFRTIFEIASLGIAQVDPSNGKIILVNTYYESITGYKTDELLKMTFGELTHPDDRKKDWEVFSKAARGEGEYRNQKRYVKKDGTIVWVRIHVAFIRDENGNPIRTVAICEDITKRIEAEQQLQNLADNLPGVVFQYLLFPDGTDALRAVSKGSRNVWGYSPEEVTENIQLIWNQAKAGGDFEEVQKSISEAIKTKSKWSARYKSVLPNGEVQMHLGRGTPKFLADGTILFNSVVLDITKEAKNEELLEQATEMAKIGSWELDMINQNGDAMYWSPMTREILEVDESYDPSLTGGFEFYTEESKQRIQKAVDVLIQEGKEFDEELLISTATGEEKWVRCIGKSERVQDKCIKIYGSFQDIDASKSLEIQVREILGSISDAFYALNSNWEFTYFNKEAEKLLNRPASEVIGRSIWEIFPSVLGTPLEEIYYRVAKNGKPESFEYLRPGDGKWYEVNAYPFNGGVSAYFKNIDERKRGAENLEKAYQEKNNILERIGDAFFALDKDWKVTYWNKRAEEIIGIPREDLMGYNLWEKFPLAKELEFFRQYEKAFKEQAPVHFEEYFPPFNQWYEANGYPSPEGISVFFRDITDKKLANQKVLEANERFEKVTEATNDAIWDYDVLNNHLFWGKGFYTLFGYHTDEIKPSLDLLVSLIHVDDRERIINNMNRYMANPKLKTWFEEYRFLTADGSFAYVIDRAIFLRNGEGKVVRVIGAMNDISERKDFEQQLIALNKSLKHHAHELELTNEQLEQFAFIASHDLQEPLRMISSFLDLLKRKYGNQLDEKALQYIHFATDGAKRMKQIILDLLEYSRAGRFAEAKEKVDINQLLAEYESLRRKVITEKSVKINRGQLPVVTAHKAPLIQTLHCLFDNAIKYSKEGRSPRIDISAEALNDSWKICVRDNGIGIDPKFHEKIFVIFQRLHDRDQYEGTGIGLAIAKKHVESWGGQIWLESTPGKGTMFYFTLPRNKDN